jgi:ribonuclease Z
MRPSFHPRLVNGPYDDPGLLVPLIFARRSLLFDLGDLAALSPGDLLKISHIFVTHTHMDHFIGFDHIVRLFLGRSKVLHLFGPPGILANVAGKLSGYTWNLVHNYEEYLRLAVTEIHAGRTVTRVFNCRDGFKPSARRSRVLKGSVIYQEPAFRVCAALLDHQIPCLGFSIEEQFHVNILKARLKELDLEVGPWIAEFKRLLFEKAPPEHRIDVPGQAPEAARRFTLGDLTEKVARITPGQKVGYIADAAYTPENERRIIDLVHGADQLFIEAAFLDSERETAGRKHHLTARQAGSIARKAQVKQMTIFHFSPRYTDQAALLEAEAQRAFQGSD